MENNRTDARRPILLVEDNPLDVDLTKRAFKKKKFINPIEIVRDGEEALAFIEKWKKGMPLPLIILLDLKLPKVDGSITGLLIKSFKFPLNWLFCSFERLRHTFRCRWNIEFEASHYRFPLPTRHRSVSFEYGI